MLKYKLTMPSLITDSNVVNIIKCQKLDVNDPEYDVIEFSAENIYNIQSDSHLIGVNNIVVSTDNNINSSYDYVEDLIVDTASKKDNTFSVRIKKELELDIKSIHIETRYNIIQFVDNKWMIYRVTKDWLKEEEEKTGKSGKQILVNQAAYGKYDYEDISQVIYYENSSWNIIELKGDNLEECLDGNQISFKSFHEYDSRELEAIKLDKDEWYYTNETYIYFVCMPTHYFSSQQKQYKMIEKDGEMVVDKTKFDREIVLSPEYPKVKFNYTDGVGNRFLSIDCHIDNAESLCFNLEELDETNKHFLLNRLFSYGIMIDKDDDIEEQEGNNGVFTITRNNIMYNREFVSFDILIDHIMNTIQIPLSQNFETDLYHNDTLNTQFIEVEKANAINPIMDLEKDVYIPAIYNPTAKEKAEKKYKHINAEYSECFKIIFNLHFREHRNTLQDKWVCKNESYWNGTRILEYNNKKIIDLNGRNYQYTIEEDKEGKYDYFSYFNNVPTDDNNDSDAKSYNYNNYESYKEKRLIRNEGKEYQSDTLAYLGFINDDIKYQKSKLKKSFLRLSFYDSDNVGNQNLLHTATIFLDSGNLFAKYIKNIETDDLYQVKEKFTNKTTNVDYIKGEVIDGKIYKNLDTENQLRCQIYGHPMVVTGGSLINTETESKYNYNGVRVNREPMREGGIGKDDLKDNIGDLETLRLSSQVEVSDKYSSKKSSEGFYFYTYKNGDSGVFPNDIYMRVDFNHAGYGRTIPFMMPYIRENEKKIARYGERDNKIKTFDDICYDWSEIDYDKKINAEKDEDDIGYGTIRYMKYSYIKWKYRYDKDTQKHIYYLDPDVYGSGVTTDNNHGNNIILNLYEGKIR